MFYHEIDTGDKGPVVSRTYRYDRVKQGIIDYHIEKTLRDGMIRPIQSPYASPVVLTRKNNGLPPDSPEAYRFAIDYRKLNAITKYPRYPLPVIDDLITNIPHTGVMSTLDLKSGYFQLAISPKDIEKTAFITHNGTFAFLRMPFGLSGAAPNFQKAIDIILKPVIGHFVSMYMDDVIITSPSFNAHLKQVFTLLRDAGLTLNKDKCHFARDKLKYLGLVISKEGIETDHSKMKAITEMKPPKNSKEVSKFLGMAGWYQKFIPQNPVGNLDGSQISCAALRALALNSREQLIREQREDPELGHIYRYLENPDDGSVNATICENWSQDFKLIDGLLFYAKYYTTLGELRVYVPRSLRETIMKEFHDLPLAGHLGKRKTYLKCETHVIFHI
ncbi:retrovirus-related Pol polyprotein from transposon opus [Trichonephila clavipes]|nr:retrovirus-related Pol polyprotein from transposon opus [Trichonephila clavipes]